METILEAKGVGAGYFGHPVVNDLDLTIGAGEVVALLGPNGAGKTTTLMTLSGLLRPLAGEIRVKGEKTKAPLHARARQGLAYVTEERSVFKRLTTDENLRVGRGDRAFALEMFPELEPLLNRKAGQLSGGEQQILSLARALSRRPQVLLADELSLGLAPKIVVRLLEAVRQAAANGAGVLLVEQHVHQALRYADRVYVLSRGRITMTGTAQEIGPQLERSYLSQPVADRQP